MNLEVKPNDWTNLDSWWSAYAQAKTAVQNPASRRVLDKGRLTDSWDVIDPWWRTHDNSSQYASITDSTWPIVSERLTDSWDELEAWWETYTETGHETAIEIAGLLRHSNEAWRQSAAPFDTDPLASPVTRDQGPLLPQNEEDWSDWLAKLLRSSTALVEELFGVSVESPPREVVREDRLTKEEGGFRRPDVLVVYPNSGFSIEVKLDDQNYDKTAETARLVEDWYPEQEWAHTLLLPKRNISRLRSSVKPPVRSQPEERLRIKWADPGPISVIFWRDLTGAIRTVLRQGAAVDDHWAANAYLFCAAAEQQLMKFQPQPMIDRMAKPSNVVETTQPISFAGVLEEQLTYLSTMQDS